mgnify:CR=1 FL=1
MRPAHAVGLAVMVGRIATGEIEDNPTLKDKANHRRDGKEDGAARASRLSSEEPAEIARKAAAKRWRT